MRAWRWFLRRPNPLITSHTPRRHDTTQTTVLARNQLIASARRHAGGGDSPSRPEADQDRQPGRTSEERHPPPTKRHLYLVLDDHKTDYGIYKLDVDADLDGDVGFPHCALIRLEVPEKFRSAQFAAVGSFIVATGCFPYWGVDEHAMATILYDVRTAALSLATHPSETLQYGYVAAMPIRNRLYVLDPRSSSYDSFNCMTAGQDGADAGDEVRLHAWARFGRTGSSRCDWSVGTPSIWELPFRPREIQAHAVHPRRCVIFVSVPEYYYDKPSGQRGRCDNHAATFAYNAASAKCRWTRHGDWRLPFKGHGCYDGDLDALVGLYGARGMDGHLCACRVPTRFSSSPPDVVGSHDKILLDVPGWRRVDAKLVYMGERGEYCLLERLRPERTGGEEECLRDGEECLLRLTIFRLKHEYVKPDHLRITHRRVRSFKVLRYRDDFEAQVFWI